MNHAQHPPISISFVLGFYGLMALIGCIWLFFETGSPVPPLIPEGGDLLISCAAATLFALLVVFLTPLILKFSEPLQKLSVEIRNILGNPSQREILILALASSIGEELLFRGAIQHSVGLFWASLLFGALHGLPGTRIAHWGAFALIVGLCFGILQEYSQSILPPIIAHFGINYLNIKRIVRGAIGLNPEIKS